MTFEPKVVELDTPYYGDLDCDKLLDAAKGELSDLIIFGRDKEGHFYIASSIGDIPHTLYLGDECMLRLREIARGPSE